MTEKEEIIIRTINHYYQENKTMPSLRYLQKELGYKSSNSISQYLKKLESKGYLRRNKNNRLIIDNSIFHYNENLKNIEIINRKKDYIKIILNKNKDYIAYQVNNDIFKKRGIIKKDILIIEKKKELDNNDIGLFIIDNKYRIMIYNYHDGFYILRDKEELILNKVKIVGRVILIERKI